MSNPNGKPIDAALVLEGGALRSVYTASILDVFMENKLEFAYTVGVSAGALCGLNYLSGQRGRTAQINTNYVDDPRYISLRNRVRSDGIFSIDYLFEDPAGRWAPFDYDAYARETRRYVIGATNSTTGRLELFEKPPPHQLVPALKASCAMPIASKRVAINGAVYLDGGIADSVPYRAAMQEGYQKVVVVKTQAGSYRKKQDGTGVRRIYRALYAGQPALYRAVVTRPQRYNAQMEEIERLRQEGCIFVIEPQKPVAISRTERDKAKLKALYAEGLAHGSQVMEALLAYLG